MSRMIDLELRTRTVWLSFPWDPRVVATVKTIPGRKFDEESKRWGVPMEEIAGVVERLEPLHFQLTPRCRDHWQAQRTETHASRPANRFEVDAEDGLTISALNAAARQALAERFGDAVWVVGEIDGLDRNRDAGHAYFELVERVTEGGEPIAKVRAVMFSKRREAIDRKLGELALADGMLIRLRGRVDLYGPQGAYQIVVEDVDAEWAVGALKRRRDQILARLEAEGIDSDNLRLPFPICPLRVGVITALDSDAYNDFVDELERAPWGFEVTAFNATMQGPNTERSVIAALRWFYRNAEQFDVLAVVRGGGARSDLTSFDSFDLGRAVCLMPMKVVCGVGHHRDQCVLDFVAHSEKTPTAAAQRLVAIADEFARGVDECAFRVSRAAAMRLERAATNLERTASAWERRTRDRLARADRRVQRAAGAIGGASRDAFRRAEERLAGRLRNLERAAQIRLERGDRAVEMAASRVDSRRLDGRLRREDARLGRAVEQLTRATDRGFSKEHLRIEHLGARLRLCDPRRVVERGYAIVRDEAGTVVTDAAVLRTMPRAEVEMRDGTVGVVPADEVHRED